MKNIAIWCVTILLMAAVSSGVQAQPNEPDLPAPIKTMQDQGAQIRYLGEFNGLNGWIAMQGGQEQYFYATEDGKAILLGLLFDESGSVITIEQVKKLQKESGGVLDSFAMETPVAVGAASSDDGIQEGSFRTPSEQLFHDVENSNWIALGAEEAPVIYTFVDPQCPHCHAFVNDLRKGYLEEGKVQLRMIPVGIDPARKSQAAFLLAVPNPQDRWFRHLDGEEGALPITPGLNEDGVERNIAIMQSWQFDVTPLTIYRARDGQIKIVQGRASSIKDVVNDL